ncbi:hypothetical protein BDP55DRAFT_564161, partial [Colletotrichum godetiae]
SREWTFGQTPLFTFSTHPSEDDTRERPRLPGNPTNSVQFNLSFEARHGLIQSFSLSGLSCGQETTTKLSGSITNTQIWEVADWAQRLRAEGLDRSEASTVGEWLNSLLGSGN